MSVPPKLSIVILSWNVCTLLKKALASIFQSAPVNTTHEVLVVDNASSDGFVKMVRNLFPQVRLINNDTNLGFTKGNNLGMTLARGDHILLLNPDTEIVGDALDALIRYLDTHQDVGLVGPRLLNPDGTQQSSRRRFPSVPILFLESTWLEGLAPRALLDHYTVRDRSAAVDQNVDWITGAAMLVRRTVIEQVGLLDEGFFMYSEELDWCHRIRSAGWQIAYTPAAEIIHYGGKSSDQVASSRHIYFQSSKVRYTQKYHGALVAELLRGSLLAQYLWQCGLETLKWVLGHRRPLRAARIAAYWRVILSGLRSPSRIG